MSRTFVRNNITAISILIFVIIFISVQMIKPKFLYNRDGSVREFGIGYKNKTIMPIWLFSLILGIMSYLVVLYYLAHPMLF